MQRSQRPSETPQARKRAAKAWVHASLVRWTQEELDLLDGLQAHLHASTRCDVVRQAIVALAREKGLLVEARFARMVSPVPRFSR